MSALLPVSGLALQGTTSGTLQKGGRVLTTLTRSVATRILCVQWTPIYQSTHPMPKHCTNCGTQLGNRAKTDRCTECRQICPQCGAEKDRRADLCRSCASSKKAKKQWEEGREKMMSGLREAGKERRRRYEDISEDTNWNVRPDGRHFTYYWEDNEKRYIYRSRWKWEQEHGEIPDGYEVHHANGDPSDDRLENLECIPAGAHHQMHGAERVEGRLQRREVKECAECGKEFLAQGRKGRPEKYCSMECYHDAMAETPRHAECAHCGEEFTATPSDRYNSTLKYCSRGCFQEAQRSSTSK